MLQPLVILLTTIQILPTSAIINCRTACARCRGRNDSPELLEVYCSMCDECTERQKEWLRHNPNRRTQNDVVCDVNLQFSGNRYPEEECLDVPLGYESTTTTSTTPTTPTTRTTTHRPFNPKVQCNVRVPCLGMPWIPAMPYPMCGMCPTNAASTASSSSQWTKTTDSDSANPKHLYLYLGVPNKILNDLKLRS